MNSIDPGTQKIIDYFVSKADYHFTYFKKYGSQMMDKDLAAFYRMASDEINSGDYIRKKEDLEKFINENK